MYFRFEHNVLLWGLIVVPLWWIFLWLYYRWKTGAIKKFSSLALAHSLGISFSKSKFLLSALCSGLALAFLIIAAANPQFGTKTEEVKRRGVEVIVALDISNSMRATDIQPDRLTAAKRAINNLLNKLKDDRLGLIVFAGESFVQLPLTSDFDAARLFIEAGNTDMIAAQGTSAGSAIELAVESFDVKSPANKMVVLISDGESHDDDPVAAAAAAAEKNIRIHCIGVGSEDGVPIPSPAEGGFKKDENGNTVVTKLNADLLLKVSRAGKGIFVQSSATDTGLWKIWEAIESEEKKETGSVQVKDYESRFQLFLIPAILLLILELFIKEKRSNRLRTMFGKSEAVKLPLMLIFFLSAFFSFAQHPNKMIREGNKLYDEKKFLGAEKQYKQAMDKNPDSYVPAFNHADAQYQLKNYQKAEEEWTELLSKNPADDKKAELLHNIGNAQMEQKKYKEAIESYKKGLKLNPEDNQTRYNLAYAQSKLRKQIQQQQQKQNRKKQQQQNQNNNNKQQDQDKQNPSKEGQKDEKNKDKDQDDKNKKREPDEDPGKISKEDAERLLKSLAEQEKNLHRKLDKKKAGKGSNSKDW